MRYLLLSLLFLATPAIAANATFSTGAFCPYESVTISADGSVRVNCVAVTPPSTPPAPPVTPPPPVASVCPPAPVRTDFPSAGGTTSLTSQIGVINSWKLPKPSGLASITNEYPGTPQELKTEWSLSKCPGDFAYYKTPAAMVKPTPRAPPEIVCGGEGPVTGGRWGQTGGCVIPAGETWYFNLRYTTGGVPGVNYTVSFQVAL
jgi:hypothetical protein